RGRLNTTVALLPHWAFWAGSVTVRSSVPQYSQPAADCSFNSRWNASSESPLRGRNLYSQAPAGPAPPPPPPIARGGLTFGCATPGGAAAGFCGEVGYFGRSSATGAGAGGWAVARGMSVVAVPAATVAASASVAAINFVRVMETSVAPRASSRTV